MADARLEGVENLLTELGKLGKEGEKVERVTLAKTGENVKDTIVREAPSRTGNLNTNIKITRIKRLDGAAFVEVY